LRRSTLGVVGGLEFPQHAVLKKVLQTCKDTTALNELEAVANEEA